jgi:predicted DNA-binding transcriptional regulator AlpA
MTCWPDKDPGVQCEALQSATLNVWPEMGHRLNVSRGLAYELARSGQVPGVVRLGPRRLIVLREPFERWLRGEEAA